jgi:hypothetical protein
MKISIHTNQNTKLLLIKPNDYINLLLIKSIASIFRSEIASIEPKKADCIGQPFLALCKKSLEKQVTQHITRPTSAGFQIHKFTKISSTHNPFHFSEKALLHGGKFTQVGRRVAAC